MSVLFSALRIQLHGAVDRLATPDAASGGNIVNQIQRDYNGPRQLTKEYQSRSGAVNVNSTPKAQYAYSEMSGGANHSRLKSMTYPDGYVVKDNYSSGLNDTISWLSSLSTASKKSSDTIYLLGEAKTSIIFLVLMCGMVLQTGCARTDHSISKSSAVREPTETMGQATGPQSAEEPNPMAEGGATEKRGEMAIIDLKKPDVKKTYFSFVTYYYGSDKVYHYILGRVGDVVYRIRRSDVSDEELQNLYREKIARDRSRVPSIGAPHRSKEFLEWLKATKVERVPGIDKEQDD